MRSHFIYLSLSPTFFFFRFDYFSWIFLFLYSAQQDQHTTYLWMVSKECQSISLADNIQQINKCCKKFQTEQYSHVKVHIYPLKCMQTDLAGGPVDKNSPANPGLKALVLPLVLKPSGPKDCTPQEKPPLGEAHGPQ